jgi:hypothetical protein
MIKIQVFFTFLSRFNIKLVLLSQKLHFPSFLSSDQAKDLPNLDDYFGTLKGLILF